MALIKEEITKCENIHILSTEVPFMHCFLASTLFKPITRHLFDFISQKRLVLKSALIILTILMQQIRVCRCVYAS